MEIQLPADTRANDKVEDDMRVNLSRQSFECKCTCWMMVTTNDLTILDCCWKRRRVVKRCDTDRRQMCKLIYRMSFQSNNRQIYATRSSKSMCYDAVRKARVKELDDSNFDDIDCQQKPQRSQEHRIVRHSSSRQKTNSSFSFLQSKLSSQVKDSC